MGPGYDNGGSKILSIVVENLHFLDSINYLPMSNKGMPKSFDLTCKKRYYSDSFNTVENLDYVSSLPEPKFYGADFMSGNERTQFSAWYAGLKTKFLTIARKCCSTAWITSMY